MKAVKGKIFIFVGIALIPFMAIDKNQNFKSSLFFFSNNDTSETYIRYGTSDYGAKLYTQSDEGYDVGDLVVWSSNNNRGQVGNGTSNSTNESDNPDEAHAAQIYDGETGWLYGESLGETDGGINDVSIGNMQTLVIMNNSNVYGWGLADSIGVRTTGHTPTSDNQTTPILIYGNNDVDDSINPYYNSTQAGFQVFSPNSPENPTVSPSVSYHGKAISINSHSDSTSTIITEDGAVFEATSSFYTDDETQEMLWQQKNVGKFQVNDNSFSFDNILNETNNTYSTQITINGLYSYYNPDPASSLANPGLTTPPISVTVDLIPLILENGTIENGTKIENVPLNFIGYNDYFEKIYDLDQSYLTFNTYYSISSINFSTSSPDYFGVTLDQTINLENVIFRTGYQVASINLISDPYNITENGFMLDVTFDALNSNNPDDLIFYSKDNERNEVILDYEVLNTRTNDDGSLTTTYSFFGLKSSTTYKTLRIDVPSNVLPNNHTSDYSTIYDDSDFTNTNFSITTSEIVTSNVGLIIGIVVASILVFIFFAWLLYYLLFYKKFKNKLNEIINHW